MRTGSKSSASVNTVVVSRVMILGAMLKHWAGNQAPNKDFSAPLLWFLSWFLGFAWWLSIPSLLQTFPSLVGLQLAQSSVPMNTYSHVTDSLASQIWRKNKPCNLEEQFQPFFLYHHHVCPSQQKHGRNQLRDRGNVPLGDTARGSSPTAQHSQKVHREKSTLLTFN